MCLSKRNPDTRENPRVHSGSIKGTRFGKKMLVTGTAIANGGHNYGFHK